MTTTRPARWVRFARFWEHVGLVSDMGFRLASLFGRRRVGRRQRRGLPLLVEQLESRELLDSSLLSVLPGHYSVVHDRTLTVPASMGVLVGATDSNQLQLISNTGLQDIALNNGTGLISNTNQAALTASIDQGTPPGRLHQILSC